VARRQAIIDRRRWIYMIEPTRHGMITAWLAGTRIAADRLMPSWSATTDGRRGPKASSATIRNLSGSARRAIPAA